MQFMYSVVRMIVAFSLYLAVFISSSLGCYSSVFLLDLLDMALIILYLS